ncbi:MAG: hydrolase [Pseudonocardia sp.]|uniref:carbon-nitrogen hydrolase family protein n=1 Tax=Pseudonocardia sp. TaxID=60912 RepID=UPI002602EBF5|nr:carbon-nitrogen hydrolase family protein [Pseudonocardia sp.]MCU1627042.1 hydrolase [Pseudonocardia sp.]MDT7699343.1 deaminated glutathione amidase [Pseudonocardiales bacterium]
MRIALAQIVSTSEPEANLGLVTDQVRAAAEQGARLVVFPEATMCCFGVKLGPVAEPLDGPWATDVRAIAEDAGVTVVAGMFTPSPDGRVRNTLLATGGGVEAAYDKIHLFDAFGFAESDTVAPGTDPVTIEVDGLTVGLSTCYDLRFPGLYQTLADRGATLVVAPASWGAGPGKRAQWDLLVRARALDSTTFVAACDQADPTTVGREAGRAPTGIGASAVAGPFGSIVAQLDAEPGLLVVDIDPGAVDAARKSVPVLANRKF